MSERQTWRSSSTCLRPDDVENADNTPQRLAGCRASFELYNHCTLSMFFLLSRNVINSCRYGTYVTTERFLNLCKCISLCMLPALGVERGFRMVRPASHLSVGPFMCCPLTPIPRDTLSVHLVEGFQ